MFETVANAYEATLARVRTGERAKVGKWLKKQRPSIAGAYRMVPLEDIEALARGERPDGMEKE